MPTMTNCTLNGQAIDIDDAIDMRGTGNHPDFRCDECNLPVRPIGRAVMFLHILNI